MTAPTPDELGRQLTDALCGPGLYLAGPDTTRRRVEALLPLVLAYGRQCAADAVGYVTDGVDPYEGPWLRIFRDRVAEVGLAAAIEEDRRK
jgi:hypothetical protein